jgi:hypothetical protein
MVGVDWTGCAGDPLAGMAVVDAAARATGFPRGTEPVLASLSHRHPAIQRFLAAKDWEALPAGREGKTMADLAREAPGVAAPFERTHTVVAFDTPWLIGSMGSGTAGDVFRAALERGMRTGRVGLSINAFEGENEPVRGPQGGLVGGIDSETLLSGAINLSRIDNLGELADVVQLATRFLLCAAKSTGGEQGTVRLGLGLAGVHEWLLARRESYAVTDALEDWLHVWRGVSDETAGWFSAVLGMPRPRGVRCVTPSVELARLAGTTAGAEPLFAVACRRVEGQGAHDEPRLDPLAASLASLHGLALDSMECSLTLRDDPGRTLSVQASLQAYVDQGCSVLLRRPAWGTQGNGPGDVDSVAALVARQARDLRYLRIAPDGRGGSARHVAADPADVADEAVCAPRAA